MTDTINDGGPAFPTENAMRTGPSSCRYEGMTMRDYIAIHASIEVSHVNDMFYLQNGRKPSLVESFKMLAELRWKYADAMLKARGQS